MPGSTLLSSRRTTSSLPLAATFRPSMSPIEIISAEAVQVHVQPWKTVKPSNLLSRLRNPIREIVADIDLTAAPVGDKPFLNLGLGDPSVFGNMPPPKEALLAINIALMSGKADGYPQSVGYDETRQAVADYFDADDWKVEKRDVIMTLGASGALEYAFAILADSTKNVLFPRPLFSSYDTLLASTGCTDIRYYDLLPESNWEIDLDSLERQIDSNTAFVLINNPSNPTGSNWSESHLREIAALAARLQFIVLSDEVYAGMAWNVTGPAPTSSKRARQQGKFTRGVFTPYATVAGSSPALVMGALSKRWLAPGWRTGWLIIHDPIDVFKAQVRDGLMQYASRIQGPPSALQRALPTILATTPESFFDGALETLKDVGSALYDRLAKIQGLTPLRAQGAMYLVCRIHDGPRSIQESYPAFTSDKDFITAFFNEEKVLVLPGMCFSLPNYLRFVTTVPLPILLQACDRLEIFCARHRAKSP